MARLPQPGGDKGTWGDVLNEYLSTSHNGDGTLKDIPQSKITNLTTDLAAKANTSAIPTTPAQVGAEPVGLSAATRNSLLDDNSRIAGKLWRDRWARDAFDAPPAEDTPTITTTIGTATTISGASLTRELRDSSGVLWDPADTHFEISGAPYFEQYTSLSSFIQAPLLPGASSTAFVWKMNIAFDTNAQEVGIRLRAAVANPNIGIIRVNGRVVSPVRTPQTVPLSNTYELKLTFPDSRPRLIEFFSIQNRGVFGGAWVSPGAYLTRPKRAVKRRTAFIGSSITNGAGSSPDGAQNFETYAFRLGQMFGADQMIFAGAGGSGYLATGEGNTLPYRGRVAAILSQNPDTVFLEGSRNDDGYSSAAIQAEVEYVLDLLKDVPNVYGLSIITLGTYADVNEAVKAGFAAAGRPYVDIAGSIFGTGRSGAPAGNGNADNYIGTDGTHPTYAGHVKLAEWYFAALADQYGIAS